MWPDNTWNNSVLGTRLVIWMIWGSDLMSVRKRNPCQLPYEIKDVTLAFVGYKEAWISDRISYLPGLVGFDCEKTKHLFFIIDLSLHPAGPVISALTGSDEKYNRCVDIFLRITQVRLLVIQNYSEIHGCC